MLLQKTLDANIHVQARFADSLKQHHLWINTIYTYKAMGISTPAKQLIAIVAGGIFGLICFIGLSMLLFRRLFDARIRATSSGSDHFILILLYVQLILGLATLPLSMTHLDGANMVALANWAQHIVTFRPGAAEFILDTHSIFKAHIVLALAMIHSAQQFFSGLWPKLR